MAGVIYGEPGLVEWGTDGIAPQLLPLGEPS